MASQLLQQLAGQIMLRVLRVVGSVVVGSGRPQSGTETASWGSPTWGCTLYAWGYWGPSCWSGLLGTAPGFLCHTVPLQGQCLGRAARLSSSRLQQPRQATQGQCHSSQLQHPRVVTAADSIKSGWQPWHRATAAGLQHFRVITQGTVRPCFRFRLHRGTYVATWRL